MPWVCVPAQAPQDGYAQHLIFHTYKETTWTHYQFHKELGASSKTYDGCIQLVETKSSGDPSVAAKSSGGPSARTSG